MIRKELRPKNHKKLATVMEKLIKIEESLEDGLSEILIDYLLQILMKDRISMENLLR